jgi:putative FmdB family regulatory protein
MPLYEYECDACGQRFEVIRKFSDPDLQVCSRCGKGPVRRLLSSPAIQFKGTGWYITDYSSKGKTGSGSDSSSSPKGESNSSNGESKKSDSGSTDSSAAKSDSGGTKAASKPSSET